MQRYDLVIANVAVVDPAQPDAFAADIAVVDGRIADVGAHLANSADSVFDASGLIAFPGAVDSHQHWGIFNDLEEDALTESMASAQGGVTSGLTYMRTGQYYLNKSGPYAAFFPEVLKRTNGRSYIDYGYHLAPMTSEHLGEIGALVDDFGVTSFKVFMFYGSHGLHGRSNDQSAFLMIPPGERYDIAHFEFVMRAIQQVRQMRTDKRDHISLSLHCETPEIMTAYTKIVEDAGQLHGLEAYSASRPPHSEGLAVTIASYLAYEAELPTINLLHLSSTKALDAAMKMAQTFPSIDFRREVTIGHLLASYEDTSGIGGKVNPPLRSKADVDALWEHVLAGDVSWVSSDHACCRDGQKFGDPRDDVFKGFSGFGGTEYLLPGLITEGRKRGLDLGAVAQLVSYAPAERFGLSGKGALRVGRDADVALVRLNDPWIVRAADSRSTQEYTPFEGHQMDARVVHTFLRGTQILDNGTVVGKPSGRYLSR